MEKWYSFPIQTTKNVEMKLPRRLILLNGELTVAEAVTVLVGRWQRQRCSAGGGLLSLSLARALSLSLFLAVSLRGGQRDVADAGVQRGGAG